MPLDLKCERCNSLIATVSYDKIREYVQKNGEICKNCLLMEKKLSDFYENKKAGYIASLEQIKAKAIDDLKHEMMRLSGVTDNSKG